MLDVDLFVQALRNHGHTVEGVIPTPENAGSYEFHVDGNILTLEEARLLMEDDETRATRA